MSVTRPIRRVGFAGLLALPAAALAGAVLAQGGDTPATATPIPSVPFTDTGTTVNYTDDFDEVCPYTGSTSPDVFYSYTGKLGELLEIGLCGSDYDTKVYVYNSRLELVETPGGWPACNDDACTFRAFRSYLWCVPADGTIYIGIDGWGGDQGTYQLDVWQDHIPNCIGDPPCIIECPPGAILEPDDCLFGTPDPNDPVNGGCNSDPPVFSPLECDTDYCGTAYMDGAFRDTDWYEIETSEGATFTITGEAEFNAVYGRIENDGGAIPCDRITDFAEFVVSPSCVAIELTTARYDPGLYWFFVGSDFSEIIDCNQPAGGPPAETGEHYTLRVECAFNEPPCPGDFDGDNYVGFRDLQKVLSNWGPCPGLAPTAAPAQGAGEPAPEGGLGDARSSEPTTVSSRPLVRADGPTCAVDCPAGAVIEPDDCLFGTVSPNDQVNGGCNADPPAFSPLECGVDYCGTGYMDGAFRDTDWYEIDTSAETGATFTITGEAEFNAVYGRVENEGGALDCSQVSDFAEFVVSDSCAPIELTTARLDSGLYWFFVAPDYSQIVDCDQPMGGPPMEVGDGYVLRVDCAFGPPPCPWDLDGDNAVGFGDLLLILSNWGPCPT